MLDERCTDIKETEAENFKRFLTKDNVEIEVFREQHQEIYWNYKVADILFHVFHVVGKRYQQRGDCLTLKAENTPMLENLSFAPPSSFHSKYFHFATVCSFLCLSRISTYLSYIF